MLNYACFEKLAMSGDSEESEVIRMYFTKLREFITDNQHVIYQAMNNKNNLKIYTKMDTIYFFVADERRQDILKTGKSSKIVERLRNYNVGRIKISCFSKKSIIIPSSNISRTRYAFLISFIL